ncbi:MAG: monovalent cation/H(+) antiporter subunit G [bacterium]
MIILANLFFGLGIFFSIFGVWGLLSFPDVFTRLHPAGKAGTAGVLSIFIGLILQTGWSPITMRIILIAIFIIITSPVATHVIARGALESKIKPWGISKND